VKNALRSKRRALLTMASVALSFCLLAVLMALYRALYLSAPATPGQKKFESKENTHDRHHH
jgi:hypothetical protein